jgi:hypothetical protein
MKSLKLDPSQRGKKRKGAQDFLFQGALHLKRSKVRQTPTSLPSLWRPIEPGDCFLNARQYLIAWLVESDQ